MANFYFDNNNGSFTEKARQMGLNDYGIGRGSVIFDLENDGDMDLLVVNQKPVKDSPDSSYTRLFRNDIADGHYLKVSLQGIEAESQGIGSRIEVVTDKVRMLREVDGGGSSHLSQNSTIAHFGLGNSSRVDSVIVTWTGGNQQVLTDIEANTLLVIQEQPEKNNLWLAGGIFLVLSLLGIFGYFKFR
jgi:hypothetical protein